MLYLRTGANGAGKTLLTLRDVREKSLAESRPVAYNGRFDMVADFGWRKIDAKDWEAEPDGTIFIFDECHNDFPVRSGKDGAPRHVSQLAEHRRRGFDFYLITQHPMNIDAFIRRLIGSPGWHQHLKRASGSTLVSVLEWPAVNTNCEKPGSGESGQVKMVAFPKEVYGWYASTSLDTAKFKMPLQVKILLACLLLVPLAGYFAFKQFWKAYPGPKPDAVLSQPGAQKAAVPPTPSNAKLTPQEYAESFNPRLGGLVYTASRYDALTAPNAVPFPSACVASASRCTCYTSQATRLDIPAATCRDIAAHGMYRDFADAGALTAIQGSQRLETPKPSPTERQTGTPDNPDRVAPQGPGAGQGQEALGQLATSQVPSPGSAVSVNGPPSQAVGGGGAKRR